MADIEVEQEVDADQQQNAQCPYCNQDFEEGQPRSELPCHHEYHTNCFLQAMHDYPHAGINPRHCRICHEPFANNTDNEDNWTNQQIQRIRDQWDTNAEFRKDVKGYIKLQRMSNRAQQKLSKFVLEKKMERNDLLQSLKQQLQAVSDLIKDDVKSSDAYKESRKAQSKASLNYRRLVDKYNIDDGRWLLRRALQGRPGLRKWPRGAYRYFGGELRWMLRRTLKLHIKW